MKPLFFLRHIIRPSLAFGIDAEILPPSAASTEAELGLMAIAGHESAWKRRRQTGGWYGRGYWQFEGAGGATGQILAQNKGLLACRELDIKPLSDGVHAALEYNDTLACLFARLLLLHDPLPLPGTDDEAGWFAYYRRNWRPGKPRMEAWGISFRTAKEIVAP